MQSDDPRHVLIYGLTYGLNRYHGVAQAYQLDVYTGEFHLMLDSRCRTAASGSTMQGTCASPPARTPRPVTGSPVPRRP